jgi:hypothetical protein
MDEMTRGLEVAQWRKSTRSGPDGGNCVEVANLPSRHRGIRDSKLPTSPALIFAAEEWNAFVVGMKGGGFD